MVKPTSFIVEVEEKKKEAKDIVTLFLNKPQGFEFLPGQFITMQFLGLGNQPEKMIRSYSISSSPDEKNIAITVKRVGEMSERLCSTDIGEKFKITGPFGHFVLKLEEPNNTQNHKIPVFLAGGSGVTPFRSMIKNIHNLNQNQKAFLFYSNKTEEEIIFKKEFEEISNINTNIKVIFTLTGTLPENKAWIGERGRINKEMIKKYIENSGKEEIENCIFYTCGPKDMVNAMVDMLNEMNIPRENIKTEKWG